MGPYPAAAASRSQGSISRFEQLWNQSSGDLSLPIIDTLGAVRGLATPGLDLLEAALDGVALLVALWIEPDGPAACDGTMGVPATVGVPMRLSPSKAGFKIAAAGAGAALLDGATAYHLDESEARALFDKL
jgi:hypothetical protein